jgi:hypothetical protein
MPTLLPTFNLTLDLLKTDDPESCGNVCVVGYVNFL